MGTIVLGSLVATMFYTSETALPSGNCTFMATLSVGRAEADARAAVEARDFRVLGVHSYSLDVPGVRYLSVLERDQIMPIRCTTDYPMSPWHAGLIDNAYDYALRYNVAVLRAMPSPPPRMTPPPSETGVALTPKQAMPFVNRRSQ